MKKISFSGVDVNNEISLLEYGLLVSDEEHTDGSGTHFCIYRQHELFGTGHVSENEIDLILQGKEWADSESLEGFYSFVGSEESEYLSNNLITKISDLISYYGSENIIGTDYYPMTEQEAIERYL